MVKERSTSNHRINSCQTLHAAQIAEALLKIQTVQQLSGFSAATIRRKVADGSFPTPRKFGTRCTRWVAGEVTEWLRKQAAE